MQETHKLSDNLAALKEKIETGLEGLSNSKELYEFRSSYLEGKKSKISEDPGPRWREAVPGALSFVFSR